MPYLTIPWGDESLTVEYEWHPRRRRWSSDPADQPELLILAVEPYLPAFDNDRVWRRLTRRVEEAALQRLDRDGDDYYVDPDWKYDDPLRE